MQLYVGGTLEPNKYYRLFVTDVANKPNDIPDGTILLVTDDEKDLDAIRAEVDKKVTKYDEGSGTDDWDTTPVQDSTKPVTSGGVYTALRNIDLSQYYTKTEITNLLKGYVRGSVSGSTLYLNQG